MLMTDVGMPSAVHGEEWQEYKSPHFFIYYKKAPQDFIESVEEMAGYYYNEIADNLGFRRYKGWNFDERAKIYIYDNADDYVQSARQAGWSHGAASVRQKVIRTFPAAHGFFDSTLPHELGHIIFREFVGFEAQVPIWFEEGVAMYQEKARRWGAHQTVRTALKEGRFMPLKELAQLKLFHDTDKKIVNLFYAESASIILYLINELGRHRFVRLCRQLKEGGPFEWALESVYMRFKNVDQLNDTWVKFLQK